MTTSMTQGAHLTRRRVLQGASALGLAGLAGPSLAKAPALGLSFVALGDWGRDGQFDQKPVADQMGVAAEQVKARFVLTVGDNFYPDGTGTITDAHWKASFEDVYTHPALQVPWRPTLGNHDYHVDPAAQIDYSARSPRWRMPARHYVVSETGPDGATLDIFILDTTPMLVDDEDGGKATTAASREAAASDQLAWLQKSLAASKAQWKVVVGHHPIYSGGKHGDTPVLKERILPVLRDGKVPLYINGHDHDHQHIVRDGMTFICTGASSKTRPAAATEGSVFFSDHAGFTSYRVTRSALEFSFIDSAGATLHAASIASA
jgi:acid phosphatase